MMAARDLEAELQKQPFQPFRIHLRDGTRLEVFHADLLLILKGFVAVGLQNKWRPEPIYDRAVHVAYDQIERVEPIESGRTAEAVK